MSTEAVATNVECPKCKTSNEVKPDEQSPKCHKCGHDLSETVQVISQDAGPKRQAVETLAEGKREPTEDEIVDATEWFLGEDQGEDEGERAVKTLEIDVGVKKPKVIRWVIGSVDRDRIAEIRREARETVARRQGKRRNADPLDESAEMIANVRIAVEGTITPDLTASRGKYADPADAMRAKFRHKSGLIDQIAGHVIMLSGFASEDVQEVDAVKG